MLKRILIFYFFILLPKLSLGDECKNSNKIYSMGLKFFNEEHYQTSIIYFKKYLNKCKYDNRQNIVDAEYYIAICSLILNFPNKDKIIKKFIQKYGNHSRVSNAYYHLGNICFTDNDFICSIEYYNKVNLKYLDEETKYELFYRLGYSYLNEKNFEKAIYYFEKIKSQKHYYTYVANYYSGYIALRQGKYELAKKDLLKASESDSYRTVVPYLIAQTYFKQKKYKETIEYLNKAFKQDIVLKNQDEIELLLAECYRNLKDYFSASKHYDNYILLRDNKIERDILFRHSYCLLLTNNISSSLKKFQYLSVNGDYLAYISSYYLGKIYLLQNKKEDALLAFEKAHDHNIKNSIHEESLFLYSKLNYDLGKPLIAISNFKILKSKYPNTKYSKETNSFLSDLYLRTNNYDLAIKQVEKENNKSDMMLKTYQKGTFYKGNEYFSNGEYEKAIEMFKKSLKHPKNKHFTFLSYTWLGDSLSTLKRYEESIKAYKQAIRINEKNKFINQTYYGLGFSQFKLKRFSKALISFKNFYSLNKSKMSFDKKIISDVELRIADCYYYLNNYNKSLEYYEKHLKKNPKSLHANLQKGIIYSLLGKDLIAEKSFKIVIGNGKHDDLLYYDDARYRYAHLAFKRGDYKISIKRFDEFISERYHSEYTPSSILKKAICHINLNQNIEAIKLCGALIQHFPQTDQAYHGLLEIQKIADDKTYNKYLTQYKNSNPSPESLNSLEFESAKAYFYDQKYEKAISAFKAYIKNYPKSYNCKEVFFLLAQSYNKTSKINESIEYYNKALKDNNVSFYNRALIQLSRIEYKSEIYNDALKHFKILGKFSRNKKEKLISNQGIMRSSYYLNSYDDCLKYSNIISKQSNAPNISYEANLFKAKCHLKKGNKIKALKELHSITKESNSIYAAESHYLIAKYLHKNNEHSKSLEELFKLTKEYIGYKKWTDKAFILIADNYISMEEIFQAKATLKSIINNSENDKTISYAKKRIDSLNKKMDKKLELVEIDQIKSEEKKEFCTID